MAPPSARETADRMEAANQTVTGLLQKIDGNIARATDFAAQLLPQVPPKFSSLLHAQSVLLIPRGLVRDRAIKRPLHLHLDFGPRIERSRANPATAQAPAAESTKSAMPALTPNS
jgi:hypothetical protein